MAAVVALMLAPGCGRAPMSSAASSASSATPLELTINAPTFHAGQVGVAYGLVALAATGGVPPYGWLLNSGALPDGLTLSAGGAVSGTPIAGGGFTFVVRVVDARANTATVAAAIEIGPALFAGLIAECADYCAVEEGCTAACGSFGAVSGGTPPYTYALSGSLPAGVRLDGLSLSGTFAGPPGTVRFTVTVADAAGATASVSPTFRIIAHIAFAGGTIGGSNTDFCSWSGCQRSFPYSGGAGTPTAQVTGWSSPSYCSNCTGPPPTPTATVNGNLVTITITYIGEWASGYTGTLTVVLVDEMPCGSGANCSTDPATFSITVDQMPL